MDKSFHLYSDEELKTCCTAPLDGNYSPDNFFVLANTTDRDCALNLLKLYAFKNKYDAINYFYNLIKEWQSDFTEPDFRILLEKINNILKNIQKNKTDDLIDLHFLEFSTSSMELAILEEGYWENEIHKITTHMESIFDIEIEFLGGNSESYSDDELCDEDREMIELFKSKINICNMLSDSDNITSEIFISEFMSIVEFFNDYFDPFK